MAEHQHAHCGRCTHEVEVVPVWAGFRWVKRAWYGGIALLCLLSPIILSELTVLIPLAVMFGLAAGPVHALAAQRPTCRDCGAEIGAPSRRLRLVQNRPS